MGITSPVSNYSAPVRTPTTVASCAASPLPTTTPVHNSIAPPVSTPTPLRNGVISAGRIHAPFRSPAVIARSSNSAPATTPMNAEERKVMSCNFVLCFFCLRC